MRSVTRVWIPFLKTLAGCAADEPAAEQKGTPPAPATQPNPEEKVPATPPAHTAGGQAADRSAPPRETALPEMPPARETPAEEPPTVFVEPEEASREIPHLREGIRFHAPLFREGRRVRDSFPVGFRCAEEQNRCHFALGREVLSFAIDEARADGELNVAVEADFYPEVDGQTSWFTSLLHYDGLFYALYDNYEGGFAQGEPNAGIAARDGAGNGPESFDFSAAVGTRAGCPKGLLPHADLVTGAREIWTVLSNCRGSDDFGEGFVVAAPLNPDGAFIPEAAARLATTQLNPQAIAGWTAGEKVRFLVVNTGKTRHAADLSQTIADGPEGMSGLDVVDPAARRIVANIPLGRGAANTLTISEDGRAAFLGSQILPQIYSVDLEAVAAALLGMEEGAFRVLDGVQIATADFPIPMIPGPLSFYPELTFDNARRTLFVSSFNDGKIIEVGAGFDAMPGVGILPLEDFGQVRRTFACAANGVEHCGEMERLADGALALTGHPAGVVFFPERLLGE